MVQKVTADTEDSKKKAVKKTTTKTATKKATAKTAATKKTAKTAATKAPATKKTTVKTVSKKASATKKTTVKKSVKTAENNAVTTEVKGSVRCWFTVDFWREAMADTASRPKTTALLAGILLTAALPPFNYTFALFLAFSCVLFLAYKAEKLRTLVAIGYWFGFGYFAAGFYWIGNALLIDVARTGWLYPLVLLLNGAFFGLFAIIPLIVTKLGKNMLSKSMLLAVSWGLIAEWLRGFILTGFPWNPVSSVLTISPAMMQILAQIGTYGTSIVLVLLASLPAIWLIKPTRKRFYGIVFLVVLGWCAIWVYGGHVLEERPQIPAGRSLVVRLVQPSIPQTLKWNRKSLEENFKTYVDLSNGKDNNFVDFTIWGETAYPFDLFRDSGHKKKLKEAVPTFGYLITGFLRREVERGGEHFIPYNSFAVINKKGVVEGWYDKNHLVPFGEYVPLRQYLPEWVKPVAGMVAEFGRGEKYKTLKIGDAPTFAPLICYEIIFSNEVVQKGADKPAWAIVLTNDGWYGNSSGPYQHLAAAQMRAVEEGITIVRSANSGISAVINPYGEITARIPLGARAAIDALVKPAEARQTPFGQYGNRILFVLSVILTLLALLFSLPTYLKNRRSDK